MARKAHGRPIAQSGPSRPKKRKPAKGRGLNALQIAEQQNPDEYKVRQHRLGESYEDDEESARQGADERSSKRRRTDTEAVGDEGDHGSDADGERWHVMGSGDEEEDDSEIESDDAFGESDEDKFAGFTFRGSTEKQRLKGAGNDGGGVDGESKEEGSEADSDDFGEEGVDLATAWDMDDADENEEAEKKQKKKQARDKASDKDMADEATDGESQDDSEAEDDMQSDLSVSDQEDGDHSQLQNFVAALSKRPDTTNPSASAPKPSKISASDLLQYVKDPAQRRSLKILQNSETKGPDAYTGGIPGRLAAPLPKRQQDKLDRSAAYDESKKELGKWVETVKQNRRAEHLIFPLPEPNAPGNAAARQLPALSQSQPMTDLERKIQEIMQESGLMPKNAKTTDQEEQEFEELEEQKIPLAEIQARRAELRKQRDLMFREEIRARRIKKIKSKAYRRIHRKERGKAELEQRAKEAADGLVDSDEEREKNDRRRAEERMGRRHRESKWAKGVKDSGRVKWDANTRGEVEEAARRDEELRRRVEGKDDDGFDVSGNDSEEYSTDQEDAALDEKLNELEKGAIGGQNSRLGNMAFMQRAEAARKVRNDAEIQQIRRELDGRDDFHPESDEEGDVPVGRQKFGAKAEQKGKKDATQRRSEKSEFEERMSDDDGLLDMEDDHVETNSSWIQPAPSVQPSAKAESSKTTKKAAVAQAKQSVGSKKAARKTNQNGKPLVEISQRSDTALDDYTSPSESEHEDQLGGLEPTETQTLEADIFAGDDSVAQDFEQEKQVVAEDEGDQIIDNGLPGWGSWTGAGISKKEQNRQKNKFLTTVKGVAPEKRQDSRLDRVIINEKRVKKNGKYLATELPHPYESRQQYERALRLPLGPEWTTKSTFQDATKPRVLVKQGVIRPMARPLA